jgi:dephospho-CoA kinase
MKVIGLTGGVGMGKSTTDRFLRERNIPVVDTDLLAREIVEPGQEALGEVRRVFGDSVIGPDGRLKRGELARRVFADSTAREQLEAILHPRIRALWQTEIQTQRAKGKELAVVVIPLLFESSAENSFDKIICVACTTATQTARLHARGWTSEQVRQRIAAQWPIEQKMAGADFVIWTEGDLEAHAQQLDRILAGVAAFARTVPT